MAIGGKRKGADGDFALILSRVVVVEAEEVLEPILLGRDLLLLIVRLVPQIFIFSNFSLSDSSKYFWLQLLVLPWWKIFLGNRVLHICKII